MTATDTPTPAVNPLSGITLVYANEHGTEFEQPLSDIAESGALIDPDTDDDLQLIGWRATPSTDGTGMLVGWEIDDLDKSKTPVEAAARVWLQIFGRTTAANEEACHFIVTNQETGVVTSVDLSEYDLAAIQHHIDNPESDMSLEDFRI